MFEHGTDVFIVTERYRDVDDEGGTQMNRAPPQTGLEMRPRFSKATTAVEMVFCGQKCVTSLACRSPNEGIRNFRIKLDNLEDSIRGLGL